jgi:glycosyltransferase involved in cell wall biosynthesis
VTAIPDFMSILPKISVITPSFNSIRTIRDTIESVRTQDYPNWEHLVIDGGSTDGTLDLLRQFSHLIWVSEKDEGHYHAMNKGILRCTGEIVNILNADDCLRPGALRAVGEAFQRHPEWDALFGDIQYVDEQGRDIYQRREAGYDYNVLRYGLVCYVIHQTLFVRKSIHDRLGLYRHQQFLNSCDYDFILRLGRNGCQVGHVRQLLINYRYHVHGQSADLRVTRNMWREATIICREHGRPDGFRGQVYRTGARLKRQWQKLTRRGHLDLLPGSWILRLRREMKPQTDFTSNIDMTKYKDT